MPRTTEHATKVSTRSVDAFARESRGKSDIMTDRHTDTDIHRQTDRQADRHRHTQTHRPTGRQTADRQTSRQTDRQTDSRTDGRTDGLSKTTFLDVLMVVRPNCGLISDSVFCKMPILPLT